MKVLVADKFEKSGVQGLQASGCEVQLHPLPDHWVGRMGVRCSCSPNLKRRA